MKNTTFPNHLITSPSWIFIQIQEGKKPYNLPSLAQYPNLRDFPNTYLREKKKLKNILNAIFVIQDYKDFSAAARKKYFKEHQECWEVPIWKLLVSSCLKMSQW